MKMIQRNKHLFFLFILFLLMFSCVKKLEYNQYKAIKNSSWESNKNINFQFQITDTITPKNLFINIRNNNDYSFNNLYVITKLIFPDKRIIIDTLQYEMTDLFGKFLGNGFSEIKDNKLFYKNNKVFLVSGNYLFTIRHAMRKNNEVQSLAFLKGVSNVGFSIENIK